jgi:hypothetical protein
MSSTTAPKKQKLTLFSVLPQPILLSQLDGGFIAEPKDRAALQEIWQKANHAYGEVGPASRSYANLDDVRRIDDAPGGKIEKTLRRIKLYAPYDSHPTEIVNARISKLVTPQISITLSRAQRRAEIKPNMSTDELLSVMFESKGEPEPITRQILGIAPNGGALIFTSYDEDIRLHNPPQFRRIPINDKDSRSPSLESVCHPIGGGLPFAAAYRISFGGGISRLILSNGIHRVYALAKAKYEWCPIAVCDLSPIEIPEQFVDLPKEILLNPNQNPPVITDFLDEKVTIGLSMHAVLKTIRLNWNMEQYVTVLK